MRVAQAVILAAVVVAPSHLTAQAPAIIFENDRVIARDLTWPAGAGGHASDTNDAVVVLLKTGKVEFVTKNNDLPPRSSGPPDERRSVIVELKDHHVAPLTNTSGYPNAFPRPKATKVLDNARVVVWDYTWSAGIATPVHFHDKDVVVIYLADGALTSTTPDGAKTVNEHTFGYTKFNPRDRVHTETLTRGQARAIIVELKD